MPKPTLEEIFGEQTTKPSLEEIFQEQPSKATKEQYLPLSERVKGGFYPEQGLQQRREEQRTERGLAPGTPLEPTGFNLENLLDLPKDIAEVIGPAMPILGASIGGLLAGVATLPTGPGALAGVAKGGAIGGAGGQALRQLIGGTMGIDQGAVIDQLGNIATEGASGAVQEVGGVFIGRMINATKLQMLRAADKLIKHRGGEGFVRGWGALATHLDRAKTQFALDAVKRGDRRVLGRVFADKDFADKFAKRLFYGEDGDIAKQIFNLSHRPQAKGAVGDLVKEFIDVPDDIFETIYQKGALINKFNDEKVLLRLGSNINQGLDSLFDTSGKELGSARELLAKAGKNIDVTEPLSQINSMLASSLEKVGFLIKESADSYTINPKFAGTTTGSAQAKMFSQLVTRFFGNSSDDLIGLAEKGDVSALMKLVNKKNMFSINNKINFGDFIGRLKTVDVQISGSEFKALGKLSPELTMYLRGLRKIPLAVEQQIGFRGINAGRVATLTQAFEELADSASLLRQGTKVKNPVQIETALQRLAKVQPGTSAAQQVEELNLFLQKNLKIDFIDELRQFKAAQKIKDLKSTFGDMKVRERVEGLMKNAYKENKVLPEIDILKQRIDPFLPKDLRIGELSQIHTVASDLHRDASSILRGKFLWHSLVQPLAGAATGGVIGGAFGGKQGAAIGVAAGLALQQPGILRFLIQKSANLSRKEIQQLAMKGVNPTIVQTLRNTPAGVRMLVELLKKR